MHIWKNANWIKIWKNGNLENGNFKKWKFETMYFRKMQIWKNANLEKCKLRKIQIWKYAI